MKKITFISLACSFLLGAFSLGATTHSTQTRVLSETGDSSESKALAEKALQQAGSPIKGVVFSKGMPKSSPLQEKAKAFSMDVNNPYLAKEHTQMHSFTISSTKVEQTNPILDDYFTYELYLNALIGNESFKELVDFVEENKAELIEEYQSTYVLIDLFGSTELDSKGSCIAMKINNIRSLDISDETLIVLRATSAYPKGFDIIHFSFFEYEGVVMYKLRFAVKIKG